MRVFLVIATLKAGGAERVISILANNWSQYKNIEVHVVLLTNDEIFYPLNGNVYIHKLGFLVNQSGYIRIYSLFKTFIKLRMLVKNKKPAFILSFMTKYNIFTLASLFLTNKKVIVSERDSPTERLSPLICILRKLTYKFASGIIVQTNAFKDFISKETKCTNIAVIPNPINPFQKPISPIKQPIILNTGRLVEKKGQKYLLEAFSKINDKHWRLVLLGDGELKKNLIEQSHALGISDRVEFKGTVKNVDEWLNTSSIFAFTSLMEGFPNALAEAMAAGLPSVSFDCPTGPSDLIIDGENGFLVQLKNVDQFTDRLNTLIGDINLRQHFSTESKKILNILNADNIAKQYFDFCLKS